MQVQHFPVVSPELKPYIDFYYLLSTEGDKEAAIYSAFPSNNTPVCFFRNCRITIQPQKAIVEKCDSAGFMEVVVGNADKPVHVSIEHGIKEFSITFKPLGLSFIGVDGVGEILQHEFYNGTILNNLHNSVAAIMDHQPDITALEKQLIGMLTVSEDLKRLQSVIELLTQNEGEKTFETIARELSLSYKSIYRLFKTHLGTSPVQFRNILRFRHAIIKGKDPSYRNKMAKMAIDSGYYDQANLINEFKKIAEHTPKDFFEAVTLVAQKKIPWEFK